MRKFLFSALSFQRWELVALATALLATPFLFLGPDWLHTPAGRAFTNFCHIPYTAILSVLVINRISLPTIKKYVAAFSIILSFGIAVELIQSRIGREASILDIGRNLLGFGLALFWTIPSSGVIWSARAVISTLALTQLSTFVFLLGVQIDQYYRFPTLGDFENKWELINWQGENRQSTLYSTKNKHSLEVNLQPGDYPGITLEDFPGNWQNYSYLNFDIYNPNQNSFELTIRVNDELHDNTYNDRFNRVLSIEPGRNHFQIPLNEIELAPAGRKLDLSAVDTIIIFAVNVVAPLTFYTDNWHLG